MERMYGVLLPMDHFHCPFFFFFFLTFVPLPVIPSAERKASRTCFQVSRKGWTVIKKISCFLYDHSFCFGNIASFRRAFIKLYLKSQRSIWRDPSTSMNCTWDRTSTMCLVLIKLHNWQTIDLITEVSLNMIKYGMILNCLKSDVDLYYIKSVIPFW